MALFLALWAGLFAWQTARADVNLCFLTLNNHDEFKVAREFFEKKLNPHSKEKINVIEFLNYADYADFAFKRMIDSGTICHGLVLSGHHRIQGFDGFRAVGLLEYELMRQASCLPKYRKFFDGVNVLWLQGCATSNTRPRKRRQALSKDNLFTHIEYRYGVNFRYARLFPNATYLGWSGSAPSKKAPVTIPYQVANLIGKRLTDEPTGELTPEVARQYAEAAVAMLKGKHKNTKHAWQRVGMARTKDYHGIFNRTIQAFDSLPDVFGASQHRELQDMVCSSDIDRILASKLAIAAQRDYLLQNKWQLQRRKQTAKETLQFLLSRSKDKTAYIEDRIKYYQLYRILNGQANQRLQSELLQTAVRFLNTDHKRLDKVERKMLYANLSRTLLNGFGSAATDIAVDASLINTLTNPFALLHLLKAAVIVNPKNKLELVLTTIFHDAVDGNALHLGVVQLRLLKNQVTGFTDILKKLRKKSALFAKTRRLLRE